MHPRARHPAPPPLLWTLAVLFVAAYAHNAPVARAQSAIPYDLTTSTQPLNAAQKQIIRAFAEPRVNLIIAAQTPDLSEARDDLLEPLRRAGVSTHFHAAYSNVLSGLLMTALHNDDPLVKLNAMVVAATLTGPAPIPLVTTALGDENPAVRYWGAKAASVIPTHAPPLPQAEQHHLLDAIADAIKTHPPDPVFERLLFALSALTIPDASIELLNALDQRLPLLAKDPSHPLDATIQSLQSIFVTVVKRTSAGQPVHTATLRHMVLVSYRYYRLTAEILDTASHAPDAEPQCIKLLELASRALPWAVSQLDPTVQQPPNIQLQLASKTWPEVRVRAEEWGHLLASDPFSFPPTELAPNHVDQP